MGATNQKPAAPANTGPTGPAAIFGQDPNANSPYYTPSTYNVRQLSLTSQPDIVALINATMQQLVGRNATADEIKQYGGELVAAEKANMGLSSTQTTYQTSGMGIGKKGATTGMNTSTGVDASAFLQSLISGTADAESYRAATGYFDGMTQVLQNMKSE